MTDTDVTKRSAAKAGRDLATFATPALLIMQIVRAYVDIPEDAYGPALLLLGGVIGFLYRLGRDRGIWKPDPEVEPVGDEPVIG